VNPEKINDWLQIAGLAGVIGSLIFVGLQLKQAQAIALSDTYQSRTANTIETNISSINSPEFLSGMSKIYAHKAEELMMPEAIAVEMHIGTILTMIENNHLQYQAGFLPEEHWQRNLDEMHCIFTVPLFREIGTGWPFRNSFDAVISDVVRQISDDTENCWTWNWTFPLE
jgi:hypothetical protein